MTAIVSSSFGTSAQCTVIFKLFSRAHAKARLMKFDRKDAQQRVQKQVRDPEVVHDLDDAWKQLQREQGTSQRCIRPRLHMRLIIGKVARRFDLRQMTYVKQLALGTSQTHLARDHESPSINVRRCTTIGLAQPNTAVVAGTICRRFATAVFRCACSLEVLE